MEIGEAWFTGIVGNCEMDEGSPGPGAGGAGTATGVVKVELTHLVYSNSNSQLMFSSSSSLSPITQFRSAMPVGAVMNERWLCCRHSAKCRVADAITCERLIENRVRLCLIQRPDASQIGSALQTLEPTKHTRFHLHTTDNHLITLNA